MSSVVKVDRSKQLHIQYPLRFKFALAVTLLIVVLLLANATFLIFSRIGELETRIVQNATSFAYFSTPALGDAYLKYNSPEAFKFREEVLSTMRRAQDIEQIMLIDSNGAILFDSADELLDKAFKSANGTGALFNTTQDLRPLELVKTKTTDKNGDTVLEILNPYFDSNGTMPFLFRYVVSYRSLRDQIYSSIIQMASLTLLAILISVGAAFLFSRRITYPLKELTLGTSAIAQGEFDHQLNIRTNDELEDLARNFNRMAEQLKINITKLEESKGRLQESNLRLEQSNYRLGATNKQLEKANEELKELDRLKGEFLQTLSHELRTPLSAIKGYNEYLLEQMVGPLNSGQEKAVKTIQRNIERLATYINALLDFSRIESGSIPVSIHPFKCKAVIDQTVSTFKSQAEKKNLTLNCEVEEGLPLVAGDRERIAQALDHLVSNAIKFTPEGGKVNITARRSKVDANKLDISVSDTGIGISNKHLPRIFNRFYQADSSATRKYGGIGLGLSLVKKIIDAHKTTINVVSKEHAGTTFTFTLEFSETSQLDTTVAQIEQKKTFLIEIIDDEPDITEIVKISLIREGYNVIDANTGTEGLQIASKHNPDIIVLDIRLPDLDGYEVLARLKQDTRTRDIPVIIMSILKDVEQSINRGAFAHLFKPADMQQLKTQINLAIQSSTQIRPTVMVVDDEPDIRQVLCDRLAREGFNTMSAADGTIALNLLKSEPILPSLILLDIMMPELSGWEVISALKADPATSTIPVILVSAKGAEEDKKRGLELGAREYIVKPFEIKDLLAEVRNVVSEQRRADLTVN